MTKQADRNQKLIQSVLRSIQTKLELLSSDGACKGICSGCISVCVMLDKTFEWESLRFSHASKPITSTPVFSPCTRSRVPHLSGANRRGRGRCCAGLLPPGVQGMLDPLEGHARSTGVLSPLPILGLHIAVKHHFRSYSCHCPRSGPRSPSRSSCSPSRSPSRSARCPLRAPTALRSIANTDNACPGPNMDHG